MTNEESKECLEKIFAKFNFTFLESNVFFLLPEQEPRILTRTAFLGMVACTELKDVLSFSEIDELMDALEQEIAYRFLNLWL